MMNPFECPLQAAAERLGNRPALISRDVTLSYSRFDRLVDKVAGRLHEKGVKAQDRVAVMSPVCWQYPVLLWAVLRAKAILCPISPRFPAKTIVRLLSRIGCRTLIDLVDPPTALPLSPVRRISCHDLFDRTGSERDPKGRGKSLLDLDSGATIVFTSGSSGLPKATLHSVSNHYFSALGSNRNIEIGPETRWLLSLPLYHVGGLGIIFRTILGGGAIVVPPVGKDLGGALAIHGVTHLSLVATQLRRLLDQPMDEAVKKRLSAVLVGGGPTAAGLITRAYDSGIPVYKTYGLTEMTSQVTTTGPREERGRLTTSGKVLDYRCVKIDDGEICVKGKTLFKGYIDADGLDLPLDEEGWFRTGDLGEMDDDGYLSLWGRKDNMFISGGENIHCEEIEAAMHRLPGLLQVVVVPVEDPDFGARPVAFVRFDRHKGLSRNEMVARLEKDIPRFKIPIAFFDCPEAEGRFKPDRTYLSRLARKRLRQP